MSTNTYLHCSSDLPVDREGADGVTIAIWSVTSSSEQAECVWLVIRVPIENRAPIVLLLPHSDSAVNCTQFWGTAAIYRSKVELTLLDSNFVVYRLTGRGEGTYCTYQVLLVSSFFNELDFFECITLSSI